MRTCNTDEERERQKAWARRMDAGREQHKKENDATVAKMREDYEQARQARKKKEAAAEKPINDNAVKINVSRSSLH